MNKLKTSLGLLQLLQNAYGIAFSALAGHFQCLAVHGILNNSLKIISEKLNSLINSVGKSSAQDS